MKVYKGKRCNVYFFFVFAIKIKREESKALNRIKNEGDWLRILNKYGVGPRLYSYTKRFLLIQRICGELILDFFDHATLEEKNFVVLEILRQCRILDTLNVDKFEMHHPVKHIIITKRKRVVMIDFERCKYSQKPKNVTQFIQFLPRLDVFFRKETMKKLLRDYKTANNEEDYKKILKLLCMN